MFGAGSTPSLRIFLTENKGKPAGAGHSPGLARFIPELPANFGFPGVRELRKPVNSSGWKSAAHRRQFFLPGQFLLPGNIRGRNLEKQFLPSTFLRGAPHPEFSELTPPFHSLVPDPLRRRGFAAKPCLSYHPALVGLACQDPSGGFAVCGWVLFHIPEGIQAPQGGLAQRP